MPKLKKQPRIKYWLHQNLKSKVIHLTADMPAPKTTGYVQCGHYNTLGCYNIMPQKLPVILKMGYRICRRCQQLTGT